MTAPLPDTLWRTTAGEKPSFTAPAGDVKAEVAVIGGGIAGLGTALALAERGVKVVLLEAYEIGFGASGRNAGFVVPNFSKASPKTVRTRLGNERGDALLRLVGAGGDRVFQLAERAGLGRQAEQTGWLQPAHTPEAARALRETAADWQALGRPVEWLDADETAARTGMPLYHGALRDRSGGMINPLAYVHGLARLAMQAGATIIENAGVDRVTREGASWVLVSGDRRISASKVILCTNGETQGAASRLGLSAIPLTVFQIATDPLPAETVQRIAPRRESVSDTRANIFTYRLDADDRLISGGMALNPLSGEACMGPRILQRLVDELDLPTRPRLAHVWRGTAAITTDFLPHLYMFAPGFFGAIGCNGRGVAMTTMLGEVLADAATGTPLEALPVPMARAQPVPFRAISSLAPSAYLAKGMWDDRRATRRRPQRRETTSRQQRT
ncbi:NAD(P)/FAD-dependent oxidoreductase [Nitratireductor pacificus]|uniref:FAD dependent oxidoreductase n=1 Tax=Nitratireductor pacificus pht-3B TaxID=391937 RepID=K2MCW6_9HYPH|nr:FAD-dependent oxidoreductase [Nitratireductor pacificus]EKF18590.1 FAD dependent oxidoreductase [Nitratireductor pacificus pht-3B]